MIKDKECPSCGKLIMRASPNCRSCGQKGRNNPYWKGGLPKCVDCRLTLKCYGSERCKSCSAKMTAPTRIESGSKHPRWKGGVTPEDVIERKRFQKKMQKAIFERDNYTCQLCGEKGDLQVDHIQSWKDFIELRFDINNCRTLCSSCHYLITYGRKMPSRLRGWGHNLFMSSNLKGVN